MRDDLQAGTTIGPYEILARLGGGPLGVVYRARDSRLGRLVAVKVLPVELTRDVDARQRFMRDAKAASALDHPNICTVFEIGEAADRIYVAMAFCDGETLKARIARGPVEVATALDIAVQVAEGLRAAHASGLIHRDIQPANVMVSRDGRVTIIDFGLTELSTVTGETGLDPRRVAYQSPRQLTGHKADRQSDVWALGVLLYEMLTGRSPFPGESREEVSHAVLNAAPVPPSQLRSGISPDLERVLLRALEKQAKYRYQGIDDLLSELRALKRSTPPQAVRRRIPARIGVAVLVLAAVAAATLVLVMRRGPATPRFSNPRQLTTSVGIEDYPAWSPDGQVVAYAASTSGGTYGGSWDIWLSQLGGEAPVNRTSDHPGEDRFPGWSPDGRQIAFWSDRAGGGYFVMPALGGRAIRASRSLTAGSDSLRSRDWVGATRPQWSADGRRLIFSGFTPADGSFLEMVTLATSETRRLALPGRPDGRRFDLSWSPDERWLAYVDASGPTAQVTRLWVLRLDDGVAAPITDGLTNDWSPSWSADGSSLYFVSNRGGSMDLWQQPIDDGSPDGPAIQLTTGLEMKQALFSPDGTKLAYSRGRRIANLWRIPILGDRRATWEDAEQLTFERTMVEHVAISPDRTQLSLSWDRSGQPDLWTLAPGGGEPRRLTSNPSPEWAPDWSPDGTQIAFYAFTSGNRDIWVMRAQGGPPRQLTTHDATDWYPAWSPDGRRLAFWSERSGNSDIWVMASDGSDPRQLTSHPADDVHPVWWPDGNWVMFASNRTGEDRLWRVRMTEPRGEPEQLTQGAGRLGRVAPDGEHVYFIGRTDRTDNIWALTLSDRSEEPITAFTGRQGTIGSNALATDGRYVYFTWQEDVSDIWVVDVSGLAN